MKKILIFSAAFYAFLLYNIFAQEPTDYLVCQDIGGFKDYGCSCSGGSGILTATGHFRIDHSDTSCDVIYHNMSLRLGVEVEITQHAGADSDKWLQHEVEDGYRDDDTLNSSYIAPKLIREINGNKIFYTWGYYSWIDNNVAVYIHYTDLEGTKPEPLEIVQAYLQKFPSTITLTDEEAKSSVHNEKWIKDEMERRVWLGDKWFMALQLKKAEQEEVFRQTVKSMNVYLDYREKYYGISATDEKNLLLEYQQTNNGTMIKNKLEEYKNWWTANKENPINLP